MTNWLYMYMQIDKLFTNMLTYNSLYFLSALKSYYLSLSKNLFCNQLIQFVWLNYAFS